ncbi:MAG: anthranilate phosphoribosyltransferase, partial [Wenzhouxiangella sp.]|nr:anthranilate phosphoribosyltransferase [Wenzhouxiangella sp.]
MNHIRQALAELAEGQDLAPELMRAAMTEIMGGEAEPAQIGGFLLARRVKGARRAGLAAAAEVLGGFA